MSQQTWDEYCRNGISLAMICPTCGGPSVSTCACRRAEFMRQYKGRDETAILRDEMAAIYGDMLQPSHNDREEVALERPPRLRERKAQRTPERPAQRPVNQEDEELMQRTMQLAQDQRLLQLTHDRVISLEHELQRAQDYLARLTNSATQNLQQTRTYLTRRTSSGQGVAGGSTPVTDADRAVDRAIQEGRELTADERRDFETARHVQHDDDRTPPDTEDWDQWTRGY
jgi:hypothetical protein